MGKQPKWIWAPGDFVLFGGLAYFCGALFGLVGYLITPAAGFVVGGLFAFLGSTWWGIGVIGKGVQVGNRASR